MALQWIESILWAPDQFCYFFYADHNVSAIVSYDSKQFLDMRTAITKLDLDEHFYFNESTALDILLTPDKALIPRTRNRKRQKRGRRGTILTRLRQLP